MTWLIPFESTRVLTTFYSIVSTPSAVSSESGRSRCNEFESWLSIIDTALTVIVSSMIDGSETGFDISSSGCVTSTLSWNVGVAGDSGVDCADELYLGKLYLS